jgi:simple sugar transport system ATP-binding protein
MVSMYPAITLKNISKTFGPVKALQHVSLNIDQFSFHALMGENGAGKSTIAKCLMGFYKAEEGELLVDGKEISISNPKEAHKWGIGMVYQHFMLVDNMTVAENLIIARDTIPALLNWRKEKNELEEFMKEMPFRLNLKAFVRDLSAGEKQKLEILKMLYLKCKILILDEPTSVLTPGEADEVLSFLKNLVDRKLLTVIIISHKFREIFGYADTVSVLRKGKYAGGGKVSDFSKGELAELMLGNKVKERSQVRQSREEASVKLQLDEIFNEEEPGVPIINKLSLSVKIGEIYGIAGVSGNGQKRLVEILSGQVKANSGKILIDGKNYNPVRKSMKKEQFHCLPEEPLKNACVPEMSVAENMALRYYDHNPFQIKGVVKKRVITRKAEDLIRDFNVKTPTPCTPIKALSGGNVQRAILARELSSEVEILVISNPCFGLDFNAIADIRSLIMKVRNRGAAVLLLSEDLDEILELSDRIGVIFNGSIIYETSAEELNMSVLGERMAGH